MGFLDRMVSDVIRKSTGFNARPFVRAVGGKNILLLGGAAVAGALAVDKMQKSGSTAQPAAPGTPPLPGTTPPPPLPTTGSTPPPPLPTATPPLPETPPTAAADEPPQELVYAIVRTMVAAALADGEMHQQEKDLIDKRLDESGLTAEQIARVRKDLILPASPSELAGLVQTAEDKELLFRFGALVVLADDTVTNEEKAWLDALAKALGLDPARAQEMKAELFEST